MRHCRESCAPDRHLPRPDILYQVRAYDDPVQAIAEMSAMPLAIFLTLFGHAIGILGKDLLMLAAGGMVYEIGKMSIPLDVLNKSGRLSAEEWALMQSHVTLTADFLRLVFNCTNIRH